jgi:nuclear GTP-binding protein
MKRIYLIDCPGVVPPSTTDTPQDILLRGVVRVENVENPEQYIPAVLEKTKPQHIERTYSLKGYKDHIEFLELLARKGGRLLHGGEPDVDGVAKMVLNDFLRGKIPWYTPPPVLEGSEEKGIERREGRLGEMGKKRKRDDAISVGAVSTTDAISTGQADDSDDDEFEGFGSDGGVEVDQSESEGVDEDEISTEGSDVVDSESLLEDVDELGDADGEAEEQLQEELQEEADVVEEAVESQLKKKRRKT